MRISDDEEEIKLNYTYISAHDENIFGQISLGKNFVAVSITACLRCARIVLSSLV
jgi:hypothetical protein